MKYTLDKTVGKVKLTKANLFVEDTMDMNYIEYWEDRLEKFEIPYAVAFREESGFIFYSIFCDSRKRKRVFK